MNLTDTLQEREKGGKRRTKVKLRRNAELREGEGGEGGGGGGGEGGGGGQIWEFQDEMRKYETRRIRNDDIREDKIR